MSVNILMLAIKIQLIPMCNRKRRSRRKGK